MQSEFFIPQTILDLLKKRDQFNSWISERNGIVKSMNTSFSVIADVTALPIEKPISNHSGRYEQIREGFSRYENEITMVRKLQEEIEKTEELLDETIKKERSRRFRMIIFFISILAALIICFLFSVLIKQSIQSHLVYTQTAPTRITNTVKITEKSSIFIQPTSTPQATKTSAPEEETGVWKPCSNTYSSRLHPGMTARVVPNGVSNRVRAGGSKDYKVIGSIASGEKILILEKQPACANNWVWWNIRSLKTGLEGWTSEGDYSEYWIEPYE